MATPSALVFKVPELAQMGYALDKQAQAEREKEQAKREQFSKSLGVESKYVEHGYKLAGKYQAPAQAAYDVWKEASVEYERTGSDEAKARMTTSAAQFNQLLGVGAGASANAASERQRFLNAAGSGYSQNINEAQASYDLFLRPVETKTEDGVVMVKQGNTWVEATKSDMFSSESNESNTFVLEKIDPRLVTLNPMEAARDASFLYGTDAVRVEGRNGSVSYPDKNIREGGQKYLDELLENDPEGQKRIRAMWYYAQTEGKVSGRFTAADNANIEYKMTMPSYVEAANKAYSEAFLDNLVQNKPEGQQAAQRQPTQIEREGAAVATNGVQFGASADGITYMFQNNPINLSSQGGVRVVGVKYAADGTISDYVAQVREPSMGGYDPSGSGGSWVSHSLNASEKQSAKSELDSRGWSSTFYNTTTGRNGRAAIRVAGGT